MTITAVEEPDDPSYSKIVRSFLNERKTLISSLCGWMKMRLDLVFPMTTLFLSWKNGFVIRVINRIECIWNTAQTPHSSCPRGPTLFWEPR